ncbi:DUF433 domain-containing protein [Hymenobacter caeli]|uniref:Uncharacterized protein (DUF433 family) n=1 Tax=Hymenobacter caeli TaxID=2735894 RepID=A0ABX2FJE7_9BACT|nr:DUF433 domain-containing protein [Hymenobacter caeli]NRT17232.1 uncharacterized protein (DUF433 family) [Hymenobacter caeli]
MSSDFPEIIHTEDILWGSPRIIGRRLAVGDVVSFMENYGTLEEIVSGYELTRSQISQALQYCSVLQCKIDKPKVFCHNCSLRREQEGPLDTSDLEEIKDGNSVYVRGNNLISLGSMEELLDDWNGKDWWIIAAELLVDSRAELFGAQDQI